MSGKQKKRKKNNQGGKTAPNEFRNGFSLVRVLGLQGINNAALAALLGLIFIISLILAARFISPKTSGWLAMPGKTLLAALNRSSISSPVAREEGGKIKIPILMYHHVGYFPTGSDELRKDLTLSPEEFESQLAWLKEQGYRSITLNQLLQYAQGGFALPQKAVILTFDDGYEDAFANAAPLLKKYGFSGSFAVITQFPGRSYGTNVYATWQQIKEVKKQGMEIISHTQDHFDGTDPRYDATFILRNLTDSQSDIKKNLGQALPILVYPYGHYSQKYIELAKKAGFKMGITVNSEKFTRADKLMEIPRLRITPRHDIETFKKLVSE